MTSKNLMAVAVGLATGSLSLATTAAIPIDGPGYHYAHELLNDQTETGPWDISDTGNNPFAVQDEFTTGTVGDGEMFFRFDLMNGEIVFARDDDDLNIPSLDGGELNLIAGGGSGSDFVVFGAKNGENGFDPTDIFTFDLGADLRWIDKNESLEVRLCRYDENQDANVPLGPNADVEGALDCRTWTVASSKTGLAYSCEKGPDAIADVHARFGNYQDFTSPFPRDFGECTLVSTALNPASSLADVGEYFDEATDITVFGSGLDGWIDYSSDDSYLKAGSNCFGSETSVNLMMSTADTLIAELSDWGSDLDQPALNFSVCLDDLPSINTLHEPIPITDPLIVSVENNGLTAFSPTGTEDHVAGIVRNGIVLRAPFVTTDEGAIQRFVLTNRGDVDAEYGVTCTPEDVGDGKVDIEYLGGAHGVIPAHETIRVFTRPFGGQEGVVEFDGGNVTLGACVITVAGKFSEIDGVVTTRVTESGATDSQNMTNDEGYVETEPSILPLDKDDEGSPEN
ncbi:MAG: hypothetical protein AAF662_03540 [Pseudomonadota bacterium]